MKQQNLFQQAKDMMMNFMNKDGQNQSDKDAIQRAIQAAYTVATPEEKQQLEQFEQQLNELQ
jgi:hypothetical protein